MSLSQGEDGDRELYNALFRCLASPERRRVLFGLLEHTSREGLLIPEDVHVGERDRSELQLTLVHNHLPKMEAAGLIRWDRDSYTVHKGPEFGRIRDLLESISEHDPIIRDR